MQGSALAAILALAAAGAAAPAAAPGPRLSWPIACTPGRTCEIQHYVDRDPGPGTRDYHCGLQTYDKHNGIDIRLPTLAVERRGVAVLAAADGTVARLRDGVQDISVRAPGAPSVAGEECGNGVVIAHGGGWETQYCHLARGSISVKIGDRVKAGTPIAKAGLSGDTEFPHLHFTVRHGQQIIDPFDPDGPAAACGAHDSLWTPAVLAEAPYHAGALLNAGFADAAVTNDQIENETIRTPGRDAPYLVAYGRAIALLPGDQVELILRGPGGDVLAQAKRSPLDHWRAQDISYIGKKRPAAGWPAGRYTADYRVWRDGKVAISRRLEITL